MTKKYTMSMYASKEDLEADKIKAAAFDWISENQQNFDIANTSRDTVMLIDWPNNIDYEGESLLEAVQNAMESASD